MTTYFDWDTVEDNIVEEFDDSGSTVADYTTEPYLYGDLISQRRSGQSRFFHFDGQGSTTELTDSDGTVVDSRRYSAFGLGTESTGSTSFPFQYVVEKGYYRESATGQYVVRRRPYEPSIARWLTEDPIDVHLFGTNLYRYGSNAPLVFVDPSGLFVRSDIPLPSPGITRCRTLRSYCQSVVECVFARPDSPGRASETVTCSGADARACCIAHASASARRLGVLVSAVYASRVVHVLECTTTRRGRRADVDVVGGCFTFHPLQIPVVVATRVITLVPTSLGCPARGSTTVHERTEPIEGKTPKPRRPEEQYCFTEYELCLLTGLADEGFGNRCYDCWLACSAAGGTWSGSMNGLDCSYWNY